MSREIKFRAWNGIDKKMIEWSAIKSFSNLLSSLINGKVRHHKLMQFTGLKDKNGFDIYEGDILARGESEGRAVEFDGASFVVSDETNQANQILSKFTSSRLLVVGNIYENPELIGG